MYVINAIQEYMSSEDASLLRLSNIFMGIIRATNEELTVLEEYFDTVEFSTQISQCRIHKVSVIYEKALFYRKEIIEVKD